jgi:hypothetical protein
MSVRSPRPIPCQFVVLAVTWTLGDLAARTCRPIGANASGAFDADAELRRLIREGFECPSEQLADGGRAVRVARLSDPTTSGVRSIRRFAHILPTLDHRTA